jgi:hypothetical protein
MDPGDKIYTIDEFRCWKVENLDDERSDENKSQERRGSQRQRPSGLCCQQGIKFMHVFFILYRVYAVPIFRTIR